MTENEKQQRAEALIREFNRFRREPSPEARAELVSQICDQYNNVEFLSSELDIINEILGILARDVEKRIRKILSDKLRSSDALPRSIAMRLAQDVEEVATPILQFSPVFTDQDLMLIIASASESAKLTAIASRSTVSKPVSERLIETNDKDAVTALLGNHGAYIAEKSLMHVVDIFNREEDVLKELISRGGLTINVAERVINQVANELKVKLKEEFSEEFHNMEMLLGEAEEDVMLDLIPHYDSKEASIELAQQLHKSNRLTQAMILRALCRANLHFFKAGLASLAGIPFPNANKLIDMGDEKGFNALYSKAQMPQTMRDATRELLHMIMANPPQGSEAGKVYYSRLISDVRQRDLDKTVPNMLYLIRIIHDDNIRHYSPNVH